MVTYVRSRNHNRYCSRVSIKGRMHMCAQGHALCNHLHLLLAVERDIKHVTRRRWDVEVLQVLQCTTLNGDGFARTDKENTR